MEEILHQLIDGLLVYPCLSIIYRVSTGFQQGFNHPQGRMSAIHTSQSRIPPSPSGRTGRSPKRSPPPCAMAVFGGRLTHGPMDTPILKKYSLLIRMFATIFPYEHCMNLHFGVGTYFRTRSSLCFGAWLAQFTLIWVSNFLNIAPITWEILHLWLSVDPS